MPANDITEDDLQRDPEPNDFTPAAIVRKLDRAAKVTTRVNGRLTEIQTRFAPPQDPTKPPLRASLAALRAQADETLRLVGLMDVIVDPR